jgi:ABC-type multidrug transport system permease subunit
MANVMFAIFMITSLFSTLVQQVSPNSFVCLAYGLILIVTQIQPLFITQRALYEVRERPSKAYSWYAFLLANIAVELPYQIVSGILLYACFYYPVVGIQGSERQVLVLLYSIQFFVFASSFATMTIAALPDAVTASGIVVMLTLMSIVFCGVLQSPTGLPGFWIFMYRVSPFTYWIGGIVSTMLHSRLVECSEAETLIFNPPDNQTCSQYLADFMNTALGQLQNPSDTQQCRYCSFTVADQFLQGSNIFWTERWRNFGIMWAFVLFNVFVAALTYYLFRVKTWGSSASKQKKKSNAGAQSSTTEVSKEM